MLRTAATSRLKQLVAHQQIRGAMSGTGQRKTEELAPAKIFSVEGWNAVVWGGGTGIGLMAAQALVAGGANKVYIAGRRLDAVQNAAKTHGNGKMVPFQADITDYKSIETLVAEVKKNEGHLNLLINNSGIAGPTSEVEKGDESAEALQKELLKAPMESWVDVFKTNVAGHYLSSVAFLPLLAAATKSAYGLAGNVINITSISGITRTSQHHFAYNASKAADIHLTTLLAQEFSRPGVKVRVNSIAPGIFPSEMTTSGSDDQQKSEIDATGYREKKGIPAGRPGNDRDMAQAVIHCAVNQYMNGETLTVDGGYLLKNG